MSWHDVHIHGFKFDFFSTNEGVANLVFDIDYILKWENTEQECIFTVSKAELKFYDTFGLKFLLDYPNQSAGMCPFSIDGIERNLILYPSGFKTFHWSIPINWPSGSIEFESPKFSLTLVGKKFIQENQFLSPEQRKENAT